MKTSKTGSEEHQKNALKDTKKFFSTILKEPSFSHYLDYVREDDGSETMHFMCHFKGNRSDEKFNETNAAMSHFVLKVRKVKP